MREPVIGEPVNLRMRKWDGSPHRQTTLAYLGPDEYGRWFTIPGRVRVPAGHLVCRLGNPRHAPPTRRALSGALQRTDRT